MRLNDKTLQLLYVRLDYFDPCLPSDDEGDISEVHFNLHFDSGGGRPAGPRLVARDIVQLLSVALNATQAIPGAEPASLEITERRGGAGAGRARQPGRNPHNRRPFLHNGQSDKAVPRLGGFTLLV